MTRRVVTTRVSKLRLPVIALLLGVGMLLAGCASRQSSKPAPAPEPKGNGSESVGTVSVTKDDDGGTVRLSTGQTLVVGLDSNETTGFRWEVTGLNEGVLEQDGESEYETTGDPDAMGAGGVETFRFKPVAAGTTRLEMIYARPDDEESATETFSLEVIVK
jgi:inhibitor of cysteine peptidase